MRVIGGTARRLILKTLPGNDTRPTTDIIKETLFNMINFDLPGSVFLDLYAGSGAIGIEALSRGAEKAVFLFFGRGCVKQPFPCRRTLCGHPDRAEFARVSVL